MQRVCCSATVACGPTSFEGRATSVRLLVKKLDHSLIVVADLTALTIEMVLDPTTLLGVAYSAHPFRSNL